MTVNDPLWLVLAKAAGVFGFLMVTTLFLVVFERKVVAYMQMRVGPNRVGPWGTLQSLADGLKLALKEDITPAAADRVVFLLAPVLAIVCAFLPLAVIPFGPEVTIAGHDTALQLADHPVAVLFVLAASSMGVYGIVLAGWASGSPYPLLGGLRSGAQMISYELAMALSIAGVFILAGSMSTAQIVRAQDDLWFAVLLLPSFVIFLVAMVGETNRAPFDLPEAEAELVGGFHTEYSSLKFAMFMLAEYVNMISVSALATTLFLGGWRAPWPLSLWDGANTGWLPVLWFCGKLLALLFVFVWLRGTLPRLRYDQFMRVGWKVLIPVSLLWILGVATVRTLHGVGVPWPALVIGSLVACGALAAATLGYVAFERARRERRARSSRMVATVLEPGGFPVPPMPHQHDHERSSRWLSRR